MATSSDAELRAHLRAEVKEFMITSLGATVVHAMQAQTFLEMEDRVGYRYAVARLRATMKAVLMAERLWPEEGPGPVAEAIGKKLVFPTGADGKRRQQAAQPRQTASKGGGDGAV